MLALTQKKLAEPFYLSFYASRTFKLLSIFNKEGIERERERLKDEINRGYFDDFGELKKNKGKIGLANKSLLPKSSAVQFPQLLVWEKSGKTQTIPAKVLSDQGKLILIGVTFRENGQRMLESWTRPFDQNFNSKDQVSIFEVSVVENNVLSLPLVRNLFVKVLRSPKTSPDSQVKTVYAFGDQYWFRKTLGIKNRLTAYTFLLDKTGLVRWRGSGFSTDEELDSLFFCAKQLLQEGLKKEILQELP